MKNKRSVYVIESLADSDFLIFGSKKRANDFIINFNRDELISFQNSEQSDLFIVSRVVW